MSTHIEIDVARPCATWTDTLPEALKIAETAARAALDAEGVTFDEDTELSLVLSDDTEVAKLNGLYRGKAGPTNVLSFPGEDDDEEGETLLGDVILAYQTCKREAEEQGKTLADHLSHLVVHGVLHLLGYDHMNDEEAEQMEALETAILGRMGIADPYAGDSGQDA